MATPESLPDEEADKAAFKEKLRSLSFGRVPGGAKTSAPGKIRKFSGASWEKGIKGEHRSDGSFMPYLGSDLEPIRMKQWGENRHTYEAKLADLRKPAEEQ